MRDRVSAGLGSNLNLTLGDQWAGDRCAEQIDAFIHGIGAKHREHEVADEFFAQIFDVNLIHAHKFGFMARGFQFLALAEIGGEGDDLAPEDPATSAESLRCRGRPNRRVRLF